MYQWIYLDLIQQCPHMEQMSKWVTKIQDYLWGADKLQVILDRAQPLPVQRHC